MTTFNAGQPSSLSGLSPTGAKPEKKRPAIERPLGAAIFMLAVLALMYIIEVVDQSGNLQLDQYGIEAHRVDGLPGIFTAPFLHDGYGHLSANALPFLLLGWLTLIGGLKRFIIVTISVIITSGLFAWALTFPKGNTVVYVVGASGLITGWLAYLLFRGIFTRNVGQIAVSVIVLLLYGGVLWGVFPRAEGVSWQAHLGGAVGGILLAWLLRRSGPTALKPKVKQPKAAKGAARREASDSAQLPSF